MLIGHAGTNPAFTCPEGFVGILKMVTACWVEPPVPAGWGVYHMPSDVTVVNGFFQPEAEVVSTVPDLHEVRFVFYAGETIRAVIDAGVDLTASGYMLEITQ